MKSQYNFKLTSGFENNFTNEPKSFCGMPSGSNVTLEARVNNNGLAPRVQEAIAIAKINPEFNIYLDFIGTVVPVPSNSTVPLVFNSWVAASNEALLKTPEGIEQQNRTESEPVKQETASLTTEQPGNSVDESLHQARGLPSDLEYIRRWFSDYTDPHHRSGGRD